MAHDICSLEFSRRRSLDRIARVAQRLVSARACAMAVCNAEGVKVVGADGVDWNHLPLSWSVGFLDPGGADVVLVANVNRDRRFAKHPVRGAMPTLRKLIYLPFRVEGFAGSGGMVLFDPKVKWPLDPENARSLRDLVTIVAMLLAEQVEETQSRSQAVYSGLGEPTHSIAETLCPTSRFLLETLIKRTRLHVRNGRNYATVRTWRAPAKAYQIDAIKLLKEYPNAAFVDAAANELVNVATALIGRSNIDSVVSVPCGHSKTAHCFAGLLAGAVATHLGVPYIDAFERQTRAGASHPRQSSRIAKPKLLRKPHGSVLLIDDVATSGRHFELAIDALSPHVEHVAALAWIGDK